MPGPRASGGSLLAPNAVARRARRTHAEIVLGRLARALLLAPQAPGDDGDAADEDGAADAAYHTADDGFCLRREGAAGAAALAAFGEGGVDGGGGDFGGGDDARGGEDAGAEGAVFGVEGGGGEGLGGLADDVRGDGGGGGEGGGVDGAAAYDEERVVV